MFFGRKDKIKCDNCNSKIDKEFNFCPYCGYSTIDEQEEAKEFGLLGRNDFSKPKEKSQNPLSGFGIDDNLINSLMNNMMKSLSKEFQNTAEMESEGNAHIEQLPNGIKIKIGIPSQVNQKKPKQQKRKEITQEQLDKMSKLPRAEAKTKMRRLSDKIIYELAAPGIESPDDVLISKLESGYEIKAIGKKKVYVNSLPVSLPIKAFSFDKKNLFIEFKTQK
jgi:hypothetical protein